MKSCMTHRRGFTIVEMIAVITIIAILATIAFSFIGKNKDQAMRATTLATINNLYTAIESYKMQYGDYPEAKVHKHIKEGEILNKNFRKFFVYNENDIDDKDRLVDPWGNPIIYRDRVASDPDDIKHGRIVIYSFGPNQTDNGCKYDIDTFVKTVSGVKIPETDYEDDIYISDTK